MQNSACPAIARAKVDCSFLRERRYAWKYFRNANGKANGAAGIDACRSFFFSPVILDSPRMCNGITHSSARDEKILLRLENNHARTRAKLQPAFGAGNTCARTHARFSEETPRERDCETRVTRSSVSRIFSPAGGLSAIKSHRATASARERMPGN